MAVCMVRRSARNLLCLFSVAFAFGSLVVVVVRVDVLGNLPHLEHVILRNTRHHPLVVRVPAEVGDLGRVATVDEEQLRRAVLRVLGALLLANLGEVPDVESAVKAGRREDRLVMRSPLDLVHFLCVSLKRVQLRLEASHVPESDRLIGRSGCQQKLRDRVERETIDLLRVRIDHVLRLVAAAVAHVPDHQFAVVADGAEELCVVRMERDVLDHVGVPRVGLLAVDDVRRLGCLRDVPSAHERVVRAREQHTLLVRAPREAVALFLVALERQVGREGAVRRRLGRVL
mmetsp:Transcript_43677/g.91142  ORF Transcript_43677/g.91142 Transcript_43677/m.91142 type:complete len:287 (-) Transcript_43677:551-1411(-)